ncbi:hypothetical protein D2H34_001181 [Vibrio fluvialis]
MSDKRSFFHEGLNSELTQGSVFYGAFVEDYSEELNYGLIITARCDISQKKAPIYSYLPLISVDNWMVGEFTSILYNKANKSIYKNLVTAFELIGGSELLLKTYSFEKILDNFSNAGKQSQRDSFLNKLNDYRETQRLLNKGLHTEDVKQIVCSSKTLSSLGESIIGDLISQNLLGYYFIDDVTGDGPHILKMRDVYNLKSEYAESLRTGISLPSVKYPELDNEQVSFTIGVIKSPYIEHILQKFSNVFARIGIDDPDKRMVKEIIGN